MSERSIVSEADLHAYVDERLSIQRRVLVDAYLNEHPDEAARVRHYRQLNEALHQAFDPVLGEPLPHRLQAPPRRGWHGLGLRTAAAVGWLALGAVLGWALHSSPELTPGPTLAQRLVAPAAIAHVVYTPEVRHPVEVAADQEQHLTAWLSKRLGAQLQIPHLGEAGYELVGGRLLPAEQGPAAQFMYENGRGRRLTLYVRSGQWDNQSTAFRYAREDGLSVFYWVDGPLGYALSGDLPRAELLQTAELAYRQLNP
jgi:anti-sigma factor RsiW